MAVTTSTLRVVSFGYGHGAPPAADLVFDGRSWFRDPRIDPRLRDMNGLDREVVVKVVGTKGVTDFTRTIMAPVITLASLGRGVVTVAIGCAGGRHCSVVIAELIGALAVEGGWAVSVEHRDIGKPVLERGAGTGV